MPPQVPQSVSATAGHVALVTPTTPYTLVSGVSTWYSANSAASLAGASRADIIGPPPSNATTGEYVFDPEGSVAFFKPIIRGAASAISRGNVVTANLWEWSPLSRPGSGLPLHQWTPTLIGRFTLTFNGSGVAGNNTLGVALGDVLATDLYCSFIAVVATYDRRGDYALRWKLLQPSVDDGSPAVLMVDGLGANKLSWEGRTTTNGDMFNFAVRYTTGV